MWLTRIKRKSKIGNAIAKEYLQLKQREGGQKELYSRNKQWAKAFQKVTSHQIPENRITTQPLKFQR